MIQRMKNKGKYSFVAILLLGIALLSYGATAAYCTYQGAGETRELHVVTSFYPMYVATANLVEGIDNLTLDNLSEPQTGCMHDYQLTPKDMKLLSKADVFVVNGGGIENFLSDVSRQYPHLVIVNACEELELEEDNAHAWMSIEKYRTQLDTIANYLEELTGDSRIKDNQRMYDDKLEQLSLEQEEIREICKGQKVVSFHEAYEYLAEEYGLSVCYTLDLDEERQVSAGEVAKLLNAIKENDVEVVFAEELYGREMGELVEKESEARVYYLNTLVRGEYEPDSYLKGMEENIHILKEVWE